MRKIFLFFITLALVTSCKNNKDQNSKSSSPIDHQQAVMPENVGDLDDIELNEGKLWQVSSEISKGIQRLSEIVEKSDPRSADDYQSLGRRLEGKWKNIEGQRESDQPYDSNLNIYLRALEQKIKGLQEVNSEEEGARIKAEIERNLQAYSSFFE